MSECEHHREALIRTTRIGLGYVRRVLDASRDEAQRVTAARHMAEMELVLDTAVPHAERVLQLLGEKVVTAHNDALEEAAKAIDRMYDDAGHGQEIAEDAGLDHEREFYRAKGIALHHARLAVRGQKR